MSRVSGYDFGEWAGYWVLTEEGQLLKGIFVHSKLAAAMGVERSRALLRLLLHVRRQ